MFDEERRKFIRHPLSYPLKVSVLHHEHGIQEHRVEADNIGGGGLQFRSDHCFSEGTEIEIDLWVEKHAFSIDGIVVRCDKGRDGSFMVGVSFNDEHELLKARLAEQAVRIELFKERLERIHHVELDLGCIAREWIKRYSTAFAHEYDL